MTNAVKTYKFGGASIKDATLIKNIVPIIKKQEGQPMVIVVSAMGKTTNALEKLLKSYVQQDGKAFELLEALKQSHFELMKELFAPDHDVFNTINDTFVEIEWVIEEEPQDPYDYLYDQVVSVGEMVASKIIAAYLNDQGIPVHWLDARDVILTDNTYREGRVDWKHTQERCKEIVPPILAKGKMVLTQGFIGGTSENFTTTLGREGSDFSAAIFSYCLDAESMSIWKDVDGVLTADPRLFDRVSKIDRLSYKEAIKMTYFGAKVIHPKTIKPLQSKSIPLFVKSFIHPEGEGTYIGSDVEEDYPPIIVVEGNQVMLHISTRDFNFIEERHLNNLFERFAHYKIKVNVMQNMASGFSVCVNNAPKRLASLLEDLTKDYRVIQQNDLELITVRNFQEHLLTDLLKEKRVLFEERIRKTIQLVVRDLPIIDWKEVD